MDTVQCDEQLKRITIWPDHCTVEVKSGLKVDVDR